MPDIREADSMTQVRDIEDIRAVLREQLPRLRSRYRIGSLRLFGSYVRRQARPDSDLDVLVTFESPPGLLELVELENSLSDLLGIPVDLVIEDDLKPRIGQRVRAEAVSV